MKIVDKIKYIVLVACLTFGSNAVLNAQQRGQSQNRSNRQINSQRQNNQRNQVNSRQSVNSRQGVSSRNTNQRRQVSNSRNQIRVGSRYNTAPRGSRFVSHRGIRYSVHNGVYYRPQSRGGFIVASAPIGLRVSILPGNFEIVTYAGHANPYYYSYGNYYAPRYNRHGALIDYVVVNQPVARRANNYPQVCVY